MTGYHEPALLRESIEGLNIDPDGIYVDATYGGGGHSGAILERLGKGKLIAFDTDPDALENRINDKRLTVVHANFRHLKQCLARNKALPINGLLADLGISSHQIDTPSRGFSSRFNAPLNMRMSGDEGTAAADLLRDCSAQELRNIFGRYGEVRNAGRLAGTIARARKNKELRTSRDLIEAIEPCIPPASRSQYLARVFQALRIAVNDELEALQELLAQSGDCMAPGGRLVVLSYHSLEDRIVKNYMKTGNARGDLRKDIYGNVLAPFRMLTRKPVRASDTELARNPRARSARLRIAERN